MRGGHDTSKQSKAPGTAPPENHSVAALGRILPEGVLRCEIIDELRGAVAPKIGLQVKIGADHRSIRGGLADDSLKGTWLKRVGEAK